MNPLDTCFTLDIACSMINNHQEYTPSALRIFLSIPYSPCDFFFLTSYVLSLSLSLSLSPTKRLYSSITTVKAPLQILTRLLRIFWNIYDLPSSPPTHSFSSNIENVSGFQGKFSDSLPVSVLLT